MKKKKQKKVSAPISKSKKKSTPRIKVRKLNRYNAFQRELSSYLKEEGIKPKDKFHVVSKKIYSQLSPEITIRGFSEGIAMMYKKLYDRSLSQFLNDRQVRDKLPFYEALAEFKLSAYEDFILNISFREEGRNEVYKYSGDYNGFVYWFTGREYNESSPDRQERLKPVHLMAHLRNNYNDSPTAEFNLTQYSETELTYEISVEYSKVGEAGYIDMGDEMSDPSIGVYIKQMAGKGKNDDFDIVKQKTELAKAYAETVREMTKAGFTKEEIKEVLKGLK